MKAAALAAIAALAIAESSAWAQSSRIPGSDWRQGHRSKVDAAEAQVGDLAFELRFGAYYPEIDEEFGASPGPYERVFDLDPQFYFGMELDWLPLHIPHLGGIGPGFGWGYTSTSAKALRTGCTVTQDDTCESGEETTLTIMPMHVSAVLRVDEIMRQTQIPVMPYAKLGFGFGTWSTSDAGETAQYTDAAGNPTQGRDITPGWHLALGGMLALNFLDRRSSAGMRDSVGIRHASLFGEWMHAQLDGFGQGKMHIGTSTWVVGLVFDM